MKSFYSFDRKIGKTRWFEANIIFKWAVALGFHIHNRRNEDHPGIYVDVETPFFFIDIELYDTRHWFDEKDRFFESPEEENKYWEQARTGNYVKEFALTDKQIKDIKDGYNIEYGDEKETIVISHMGHPQ